MASLLSQTPLDGFSLSPAFRRFAYALSGLALMAYTAPAQAEDIPITVQVGVTKPLTLSNTEDMEFGWVTPIAGNVDMTYDVNNGSSCVATVGLTRGGTCEAAEFTGTGGNGSRIRIRLPAKRRAFLTGPGQRIRVNRMDIYETGGLNRITQSGKRNQQFDITDADGDFSFRVGGRLRVRANQAPGLYEGTFNVEVEYR